ncbi:hypothetical protein HCUR_00019 [Holospora curviuscula]|uniref:Uncharacterized protein n=1 Tax=Holospora curviuscula TaxID=1082868 RepID=A0A2S5RIF4_9PROT|nr:hypothetical protein HCUR_00019 [Holospora curviuscula]
MTRYEKNYTTEERVLKDYHFFIDAGLLMNSRDKLLWGDYNSHNR